MMGAAAGLGREDDSAVVKMLQKLRYQPLAEAGSNAAAAAQGDRSKRGGRFSRNAAAPSYGSPVA